jgi:hypothetical protein
VDYTFFLGSVHIGTEYGDVSKHNTIDRGSISFPRILLGIVSRSVVSGSHGCILRLEVDKCVQWWMVSLNCVCPGSLIASVFGLSCFAQLEGPSLEGVHHIVHLGVDRIFGFSNGNFPCGLHWCLGFVVRDCQKDHNCWHLHEQNSSWD